MTDREHHDTPHDNHRDGSDRNDAGRDERLVRRLAALPREIDPPRDLWQGIEARIESRGSTQPGSQRLGSQRLGSWPVWAGLAAMLLIALGLAVSWQWIGFRPSEGLPTAQALTETEVLAWQARQEDHTFVTRQALEGVLGTARETGRLSPEAAAGLSESVAALDRAIGETRAALDRDPANPQLRLLLAQRYQQEAALLHRVRSL